MKIAFFSNFMNHHQVLVADALFSAEYVDYIFVETMPMPDSFKKSGYPDYSTRPYLLQAWKDDTSMKRAKQLAIDADVAVFGGCFDLMISRAKSTNKISFCMSERWLKKGISNLLSPLFLKHIWYYYTLFRKRPMFYLCNSAFTAKDVNMLGMYKKRCYKFGYFPRVSKCANNLYYAEGDTLRMMWCARFIDWKHPEMPIMLAKRMKDKGYIFHIDMYGNGRLFDKIQELAEKMSVTDVVSFCGNLPNDQILDQMKQHHVFLFTSDRNEGWGAVANEAMSNGCVLIAGNEIGSVPYLVRDGINGLVFYSKCMDSLCDKVEWLIKSPSEWSRMSFAAIQSMQQYWSPEIAARNFLSLVDDIKKHRECSIIDGPCSIA